MVNGKCADILIAFAIGVLIGVLIAAILIPNVSSYKPQQKGFADRLYGEKFKYPAYLDQTKRYNLPPPEERRIGDFGLI